MRRVLCAAPATGFAFVAAALCRHPTPVYPERLREGRPRRRNTSSGHGLSRAKVTHLRCFSGGHGFSRAKKMLFRFPSFCASIRARPSYLKHRRIPQRPRIFRANRSPPIVLSGHGFSRAEKKTPCSGSSFCASYSRKVLDSMKFIYNAPVLMMRTPFLVGTCLVSLLCAGCARRDSGVAARVDALRHFIDQNVKPGDSPDQVIRFLDAQHLENSKLMRATSPDHAISINGHHYDNDLVILSIKRRTAMTLFGPESIQMVFVFSDNHKLIRYDLIPIYTGP
ncbi:MAG: hypothetical protein WBD87_11290 [Candidatus Acidiferrales bacterium]